MQMEMRINVGCLYITEPRVNMLVSASICYCIVEIWACKCVYVYQCLVVIEYKTLYYRFAAYNNSIFHHIFNSFEHVFKNRETNSIVRLKPSDYSIAGVILPEEVSVSQQKERIKLFCCQLVRS